MKIIRLEVFVIGDSPEIDPDKGGVEPLACVRIHTDEGLSGLSEVFRVPHGVVQATVGDVHTHFGRLLIGQEITHPERLWQHMWDAFMHTNHRGWEIIILGAMDVAIWDLYGQMLNQPVWKLLGGAQRGPFQSTVGSSVEVVPYCTLVSDFWGGEPMFSQQVARAEKLAALGYRAFKVEPMMSTPRDVVELARRCRKAIGDDLTLMVDVGYLFFVQPYMTTCGGLTEAKRIVDLALSRGAQVCPGNWSTQILGAASVHLAAYSPITPFIEFAPAEVFESPLRYELQNAGFPVIRGAIALPERPGIGYQLPTEIVERFRPG